MKSHLSLLPQERQFLKTIYNFAKSKNVSLFLVGGMLRDKILGRIKENPDFDFAIKKNAINFSRLLSKKLKCGFVVLDKEHGSCRLVKKHGSKIYTFDFTDFRGKDLRSDLKYRDFALNALALKLEDGINNKYFEHFLIDPYSGKSDIQKRLIRVVDSSAFTEDPLRILRAFSFSSCLGFAIDNNTLKLAKQYKDKLSLVSPERIREELFKMFSSHSTYDCLISLDKIRVLDILFPEIKKMRRIGQGPYHHLDVWQHTLETVKQLELIFNKLKDKEVLFYLNSVICSDRRRKALLKFAAFLHDIGKPKTLRRLKGRTTFHGHERVGLRIAEDIAKRLKLSNDETYTLRKIVLWHLRPGYLADSKNPTPRAKFRYFRDTGQEALSTLLLSLADQRSTKGPLTTRNARKQHERIIGLLIREYLNKGKEEKPIRLLN
ncbi:MAG: HD domain-containing protein, partial [Candidatus Omnitrophica bacterium]|nr:HD domain-containing protein [Candidatus Omnitrophota bacterium]